ncbi:MAG: type II secretion system protein [Gammaproteobacteria bacterium]|nr:type II secretion system protein [Gammaproteobacteria bacterium]
MMRISATGRINHCQSNGFTLIELLIVLTIVSVLVSSISYVVINQQPTLKDLSSSIVYNLRMVQQRAIRNDEPYQIEVDLSNNVIHLLEETIDLPSDVTVTVKTSEDQLIDNEIAGMTFYPDASSSGGMIILETDMEMFEISVIWISGKIETSYINKNG